MEETPLVEGDLIDDQACISNKEMIHDLELKGYGDLDKDKLFLKSFESLYLLYLERLILKKNSKKIDFDTLMNLCQKNDTDILTKFLIYRDLRNRGYVVKDGFGFGSDFRVYERGQFGEKGSKFLIFGLNEGQQEKMGNLQKKIEQITQMGKEPVIAVIERRGEVIYYKINRMDFYENKSRSDNSVQF
ncbi:MAG: tRNA-intron lyase [Nitrosarchaeum sp.]|nr:tRNA-intron lyase [Nitrosarchaeum sp.]MCV0399873.1 tRNA-intron lyase [Nitrosarchaeum sp.]